MAGETLILPPEAGPDLKDQYAKAIGTRDKLELLRKMVNTYMERQQFTTALYWADKVVTLSEENSADVYTLAQTLFHGRHYHRACFVIESRKLHLTHLGCCYVAVNSLHLAGEEQRALELLEEAGKLIKEVEEEEDNNSKDHDHRSLLSSIYLLKGNILENLDNRALAADCFKMALKFDVFCFAAFDSLVQHQMLSAEEERELIRSLPFKAQNDPDMASFLYNFSLKKYECPASLNLPDELEALEENCDVRVCIAERHYYNCDYIAAFEMSSSVMKQDPFHPKCLPIHVALLVELNKTNMLFHLAHRLVDLYPEWAVSWFAVGCYYYMAGKQDPARRYISKATQLDRLFGPAWLTYGHSFAVENEHDQAMAAYFKASQLMQGCHLPLLYIGLEYSLTNNQNFAERFFNQALDIAPHDPFVLHELGVTAYNSQDYQSAERYFKSALQRVQAINSGGRMSKGLSEKWESLLNNLGHTLRKMGRYEEALAFHQQALVLSPLNPATYSAIGYVQALTNDLTSAVESFHKALGIRREDTFSTNMLNDVIEQLMCEVCPFPDYPDEIPRFEAVRLHTLPLDSSNDQNTSGVTGTPGDGEEEEEEEEEQSIPRPRNLQDTSNLSIDCDMEDVSRAGDMDQTS